MTLGRNFDCFINRVKGSCIVAIQSVGICQIGKNPGFGFRTCLSRSRKV
jgi:hypothetical protein